MAKREPIEWVTIEHPYHEKSGDWYWIVGIIGVTAAVLSFIFANLLFGVLLLIITATTIIQGSRIPNMLLLRLGPQGVRVGEKTYLYTELEAFSIDEESDTPILALVPRGWHFFDIRYPIEDVEIEDVRDYLLDHLNEVYHEEHFSELIARYLGF